MADDTQKIGLDTDQMTEEEKEAFHRMGGEAKGEQEGQKGEKGGQTESGDQNDPMQDWPSDLLDE